MEYQFKTKPFAHQLEEWNNSKDVKVKAIFWEQGTGKTKLIIDTAAHLYLSGKINGMLVLAPSGVHYNWVLDEIPDHLPNNVKRVAFAYSTQKSSGRTHEELLAEVIKTKHFGILSMSYDSFITSSGKQAAWDFMRKRKIMYVLDEAVRIKNPKAERSIAVIASGDYAKYKRVLTGTPIANGPFDIYNIIDFLDKSFWSKNRFRSFYIFKHYFGDIIQQKANLGHMYESLRGYRNLDELYKILKPISTRVTKDQVLDLPPKLYKKVYFDMTPQQAKIYKELKEEYMTWVGDNFIEAKLAITRLLRLQQVTSGYLPNPVDDPNEEPTIAIPGKNPRLQIIKERCENLSTQGIIWGRFRLDMDLIEEALGSENVSRYDGTRNAEERRINLEKFKKGKTQFFIATTATGGEGLTLNQAKDTVYYSNSFKLTERLQSEDRNHRIGQNDSILYTDILAKNTIDEYIVGKLRKKLDISQQILGDEVKQWI